MLDERCQDGFKTLPVAPAKLQSFMCDLLGCGILLGPWAVLCQLVLASVCGLRHLAEFHP